MTAALRGRQRLWRCMGGGRGGGVDGGVGDVVVAWVLVVALERRWSAG